MTQNKQAITGFNELGVAPALLASLEKQAFNQPTPIQHQVIPLALEGKDVVGIAQTGTGKTLAFGIPMIQRIGLYQTKARHLMQTCRLLVDQYSGAVPQTREALEALPGVGRKTANVILNTAFGQTTIAVDTHVFRVANRIGLARGTTVLEVENRLLEVVPDEFKHNAHHWLILHGRYVCKARKPECGTCLISDLCEYEKKEY